MPFLGHLALYLKPSLSEAVPTIRVWPDGTLHANPGFIAKLSKAELAGAIVHETLHLAFLYWSRLKTREPVLFNLAHDFSINLIIQDLALPDIQVPAPAALNRDYAGLSAEEIYALLFQKRRNHRLPALGSDCAESFDAEKTTFYADKWKTRVSEALTLHERLKGKGKLPGSLLREINLLVGSEIDWHDEISNFIGDVGRRVRRNPLRQSRRGQSLEEIIPARAPGVDPIVVMLDTSSSIDKPELSKAVAEIAALADSIGAHVRVIIIDSKIQYDVEVRGASDLIGKLQGGGGSSLIPAFEKLERDLFCGSVIAFTDGLIDAPQTQPSRIAEVVWVIGKNNNPPCSWGRVIRMNG
jgi:predicted metal-dependent peptidase